jgi:hypothetical protein
LSDGSTIVLTTPAKPDALTECLPTSGPELPAYYHAISLFGILKML